MHMRRAIGAIIGAVVLIVLQHIGNVRAEEKSHSWQKVDTARWIRITPTLGGRMTFIFERRADGDWFSVTSPCAPFEQRTYTSTWKRGDSIAVTWLSCNNRLLVEREVGELEIFFLDLPDGTPPAKPAEFYKEAYSSQIFV